MNTLKTITLALILFFPACTAKEAVQVLPSTTETVLVVETETTQSESTSSETGDGDGDGDGEPAYQEIEVAPIKTEVKVNTEK